jgi:hypothetical protein
LEVIVDGAPLLLNRCLQIQLEALSVLEAMQLQTLNARALNPQKTVMLSKTVAIA